MSKLPSKISFKCFDCFNIVPLAKRKHGARVLALDIRMKWHSSGIFGMEGRPKWRNRSRNDTCSILNQSGKARSLPHLSSSFRLTSEVRESALTDPAEHAVNIERPTILRLST